MFCTICEVAYLPSSLTIYVHPYRDVNCYCRLQTAAAASIPARQSAFYTSVPHQLKLPRQARVGRRSRRRTMPLGRTWKRRVIPTSVQ